MHRISDIVFTTAGATIAECTRFVSILAIVQADGLCWGNVAKVVVNSLIT